MLYAHYCLLVFGLLQAFLFFHYLWISPIHLIAFTFLVYREIGWSAFLASGFIVLQVPLQIFLARLFAKLRLVCLWVGGAREGG